MSKFLTKEQIALLFEEYRSNKNETTYTLAKKAGVGYATMYRAFAKFFKEEFKNAVNSRKKLNEEKINEICNLYQKGKNISEIAQEFNVDKSTIRENVRRRGIKIRSFGRPIKYTLPESAKIMSKEKAYILGVMCGDGSVYKNKQDSRKIALSVSDKDFAIEFARCLKAVYGIEPIIHEAKRHWPSDKNWSNAWETRIFSKKAYEDILSYDSFRTESWKVPEIIFQSSVEIKTSFLRGFFDSESCVSLRRIIAVSINKYGMNQIGEILKSLGINHRIKCRQKEKSSWQDQTIIDVTGIQNLRIYKDLIGFSIERKQNQLNKMLSNYQVVQKTHEEVKCLADKMFELRNQNLTYEQIAKTLGIGRTTVSTYITKKHKSTEPISQQFAEIE